MPSPRASRNSDMSAHHDSDLTGRASSYPIRSHGQSWNSFWDNIKGPQIRRFHTTDRRRRYETHENDLMEYPDNHRHVAVLPITTSSTAFGNGTEGAPGQLTKSSRTSRTIQKLTSALSSAFTKGNRYQAHQPGVIHAATERHTHVQSFC